MKILTVFTGGTISCFDKGGVLSPDSGSGSLLLERARQAGVKAEFITTQPYLVLSENLTAAHLTALRRCLDAHLSEPLSGVIVTHGTDTLAYTAAYLDFVFGAQPVPIALVSANYPLHDSRSNGLENFLAAVKLIEAGESGVFVPYRNTGAPCTAIHRGRDVLPHRPYDDAVDSLFGKPYGWVRAGGFFRDPDYPERVREDLSDCELNGRVLFLRPYVGMNYPALPDDCKAVLLESWHAGTLPTATEELQAFCRTAREKQVPVYLTGCTEGFAYESKLAYGALGIHVLPPMSPIAAYMYLLLRL